MKQTHLLIILMLIFASANVAVASYAPQTSKISFQVDYSDRIVIGTVMDIQTFYNYTLVTIEVNEWLMNPLHSEKITVKTDMGTNVVVEGNPTFTENETTILMLEDVNVSENIFRVRWGELGKHPISEKETIEKEIDKPDILLFSLAGGLAVLVTLFLIYDWFKNRR